MEKQDSFWGNIFNREDQRQRTVIERLKNVPLFSELSARELAQVAHITHIRTYETGEAVFFQEEPGAGMYIIEEGQVDIVLNLPDEAPLTLTHLEEGDFFGELALLDESPRSADAIAQTPSTLIGFFRPDLLNLLDRHPSLGGKVLLELARIVGVRLRSSNTEVLQLKTRIARSEPPSDL